MNFDISRPFEELADHTAVVTGGARGIGLAITDHLLRIGMSVLIVDRDADALEGARNTLGGDAWNAVTTLSADLSADSAVSKVADALESLPPLTVWVNNAGRVSNVSAADVESGHFEEVMRDNSSSVLRGSQIAHRFLSLADQGGAIVNVTSLVTRKVLPGRIAYATSKAAVESITRYCASEWGPSGIRVNAVSPGYVDTRLTSWPASDPRATAREAVLKSLPLPRSATTNDVAMTVLYLASPLAAYVTGETVLVDGGWHLT